VAIKVPRIAQCLQSKQKQRQLRARCEPDGSINAALYELEMSSPKFFNGASLRTQYPAKRDSVCPLVEHGVAQPFL
jgi:hypothetical protein